MIRKFIELFTTDAEASKRLEYLFAVVEQSQVVANQVYSQWTSGGYNEVFVNANGNAVGSSVSLMMNSFVLDFERFIRDGKVGIPLGVRSLGTPNPEKVEAYYSEKSLELLNESMTAYKRCFKTVLLMQALMALGLMITWFLKMPNQLQIPLIHKLI